jgi:hypothetical protein
MRFALALLACSIGVAGQSVTFYRDIVPVLQNNCQTCHRPGEIGPMSFLSYESTRPWAKAIKSAVLSKKMPPWFADPKYGHFSNDNRLKDDEIQKLVAWVDAGAPAGDAKDAPPPVKWLEGWNIGQPDVVIEMPTEYTVPATGTIDYTYVIVPSGFTKDTWVQAAEVRPGNRSHVHHANVSVRPPDSKYFREYPMGTPFVPKKGASSGTSEYIVGYTPGKPAINLASNEARLIPAGSDFIFQLHYTANGTSVKDRTKIGIIFAKNPPERRVSRVVAANNTFAIPPGNPDYHVDGAIVLNTDAEIVSLKPHMHLRGKWMEFRAIYPTGETETLLSVPHYDFNWQLDFVPVHPIKVPKGTRLEVYAGFDNSPNNPYNPDPTATIRWGDQSWDEMMGGFFEIAYDPKMDPSNILEKTKRTVSAAAVPPE